MDREQINKAEQAVILALSGMSNAEIGAITGLRGRSVRDALRLDIQAGLVLPNADRKGAGAMARDTLTISTRASRPRKR